MRPYNAKTIFRRTSSEMLANFFEHEKCMNQIDFKKDRLYEIQEAFTSLPDQLLHRLEIIMRNVFNFANSENTMLRLIDEIKTYEASHEEKLLDEFLNTTSCYDKCFFIYLHYPEIWANATTFSSADNLTPRYWNRCAYLPRTVPAHDDKSIQQFGQEISDYFWKTQFRGKRFCVEYHKRSKHMHYYFVYLSDYANNYDYWQDDTNELSSRNETRPINMVFAFDELYGTLDTYNHGGCEVTEALRKIFCNVILNHNFQSQRMFKSVFNLNPLQKRENMLKPRPDLGVTRVRLTSLEFTYNEVGHRWSQRIKTNKNAPDDEIYDIIETFMNTKRIDTFFLRVRYVQIVLDIKINNSVRTLSIELTPNACTLKNNCEELRIIGETLIKGCGIDVQPDLF